MRFDHSAAAKLVVLGVESSLYRPRMTDALESRNIGILWMLATMLCFITLDAIMKYLLEDLALIQVVWARFFFATVFAIAACGKRLPALVQSRAFGGQLLRSFLLMATTAAFATGIATTPLATGTTIMFLSPILITLLAIPLLGEQVGVRRWAGIVTGLIGAVIVTQPWKTGVGSMDAGALFLLLAAFFNAMYQIMTRMLRADDPLTTLLFTAVAGAAASSCLVAFYWTQPTSGQWLLMIASGAMGGLGHLFLIRAFRHAPASVLAPFSYSALVWATLFGLVIWHDWPDAWTWTGAALIVASGLYIFHRESRQKQVAVST
jgi:drug/metabolite transporter (DMT)-like permease